MATDNYISKYLLSCPYAKLDSELRTVRPYVFEDLS